MSKCSCYTCQIWLTQNDINWFRNINNGVEPKLKNSKILFLSGTNRTERGMVQSPVANQMYLMLLFIFVPSLSNPVLTVHIMKTRSEELPLELTAFDLKVSTLYWLLINSKLPLVHC